MAKDDLLEIPSRCPVTGGSLYVSELTNEDGSVVMRGKFKVPTTAAIDRQHQEFLEVFLRSRGVISTVEKELGISYPTVRARLDSLLDALHLTPVKEDKKKADFRRKILQQLEEGKITAAEAKAKLKGESK